jgi:hypothetical protein
MREARQGSYAMQGRADARGKAGQMPETMSCICGRKGREDARGLVGKMREARHGR